MITITALEEAGYILPPRTPMIMNAASAAKPAVANTDQRTGIARIRRAEAAMHRAAMNTDVVVVPLGISSGQFTQPHARMSGAPRTSDMTFDMSPHDQLRASNSVARRASANAPNARPRSRSATS
jgi:hypothetical protein